MAVERPECTWTIPPDPLVPLPILKHTAPPRPAVALPEPTKTYPLFPAFADPELKTNSPLEPEPPASALAMHTSTRRRYLPRLTCKVPRPWRQWFVPKIGTLVHRRHGPLPELTRIEPLRPPVTEPDPSKMAPEFPDFAEPELKTSRPLEPADPELVLKRRIAAFCSDAFPRCHDYSSTTLNRAASGPGANRTAGPTRAFPSAEPYSTSASTTARPGPKTDHSRVPIFACTRAKSESAATPSYTTICRCHLHRYTASLCALPP